MDEFGERMTLFMNFARSFAVVYIPPALKLKEVYDGEYGLKVLVKSQSIIHGVPFLGTATLSRLLIGTQNEESFILRGSKTSFTSKSSRVVLFSY